MGNFKRIGGKRFGKKQEGGFAKRGGDRPFFAATGRDSGRDRRPVTMHRTTCAQCGESCEVPFRPTGDKPLYCQECFSGKRSGGGQSQDNFSQRDRQKNGFSRPGFRDSGVSVSNGELVGQLKTLNAKIDRLIKTVEAMAGIGPVSSEAGMSETAAENSYAKPKKEGKGMVK